MPISKKKNGLMIKKTKAVSVLVPGSLVEVTVSLGVTINKGNFESMRADCGMTATCKLTDYKAGLREVEEMVTEFVQAKTHELRSV